MDIFLVDASNNRKSQAFLLIYFPKFILPM
jgi:hypothetical protein